MVTALGCCGPRSALAWSSRSEGHAASKAWGGVQVTPTSLGFQKLSIRLHTATDFLCTVMCKLATALAGAFCLADPKTVIV